MFRILTACLTLLTAGAAHAETLRVATSFTIIADMARNVGGHMVEVHSITPPGAEIHDYQPSPRDITALEDVDLVLVNGLNLDDWAARYLARAGEAPVVTLGDAVQPLPVEGTDSPNPHAWMSLENALAYVDAIARALSASDPDNADAYAQNARDYGQRIQAVIGPLRDRARALPPDRRVLVTSEGAFSYLARDFGLSELYLWPINSEGQGTPQQVRRLIDRMRQTGAPVIFSESTVSDRPARRIARETGAEYGGVLFVDSLSDEDGPVPTYLDLLRVTAETILERLEDA